MKKLFTIPLFLLVLCCSASGPAAYNTDGELAEYSLTASEADSLLAAWNRLLPEACTLRQRIILNIAGKQIDFIGFAAIKQPDRFRIMGFGDMGGLLFDFLLDSSGTFTVLKKPGKIPLNPLKKGLQPDLKHLYLSRSGPASAYTTSSEITHVVQHGRMMTQTARFNRHQQLQVSEGYSGDRKIRTVTYDFTDILPHSRGTFPGKITLVNHRWRYSLEIETTSLRPLVKVS